MFLEYGRKKNMLVQSYQNNANTFHYYTIKWFKIYYQKQLIIQLYQNLRLKPVVIYINIQRLNLLVMKKQNILNTN